MRSAGIKRAYDLQAHAAGLGFDWADPREVLKKADEELAELRNALESHASSSPGEELGDLLFVLVNLSRHLRLDPDTLLHQASDKFERRFSHVLTGLARQGIRPQEASLETMNILWDEAKQHERR